MASVKRLVLYLQLHGRKQHIRALLIDRVMLQHEVSCLERDYLFRYHHILPFITYIICVLSAAEADGGRMSVQEHSPGADERSVEAFHKHLQSSEFHKTLHDNMLSTSYQAFISLLFCFHHITVILINLSKIIP